MRSRTVAAALALALLSGCCWITQGTTEDVLIDSTPSRAKFRVVGLPDEYVTPATVRLPRSEQTISFNIENYSKDPFYLKTRTSTAFYFSLLMGVISGGLDLLTGSWQEFDLKDEGKITFALKPVSGNPLEIISFSSNPTGATILIDDVEQPEKAGTMGSGARKIRIKWGGASDKRERKITFKYEGFQNWSKVLRYGDLEMHAALVREPDRVMVQFDSEPSGAEVLVEGKSVVPQTSAKAQIEWADGDWRPMKVEFRKAGYKSAYDTLKDKKQLRSSAKLEPEVNQAILKLDCSPAGVTVEVDGKEVGTRLNEIKLGWSIERKSYKLKFSRPGYVTEEKTVEEPQKEGPLQVRLKPSLPGLP